ncbi:16S rRNA methyltransferase [Ignicoccus pacificus DSM 13166]|uniref:tRNA (cytosine(72)-C(5))-methyltransferase n=1 Tax=Ignicoccus pacificus DSM 13166 TaxID=940294 RepID=A0A977PKB1_9CREN|nr:16S rRNA methyltransferase [Ignicoccus pacificus DSM 13166]
MKHPFWYGKLILEDLGSQFNLDELFESLRTPGRHMCLRVNLLKASPEEVMEELEEKGYKPYQPFKEVPEAVCVRVEGPFEIPRLERFVIADKYAAESVYVGANLYSPGVLKSEAEPGREVSILAERTLEPVAIGISKIGREVPERGIAVEVTLSKYKAPKFRELKAFEEGKVYPQSLPAMVAVRALEPEGLVVDLNAAPGGKSFHAYELLKGKGKVISFEVSKKRANKMRREMRRLGHEIELMVKDSRYADLDFPELVEKADRVIVDPPCTSIGVIPKVWDEKKDEDMLNSFKYQIQFVKVAYKLLKKGGLMLYSTCTLTKKENEEVLDFAQELGFEIVERDTPWGKAPVKVVPYVHQEPGFFISILKKP